jgi:hypothetical protein
MDFCVIASTKGLRGFVLIDGHFETLNVWQLNHKNNNTSSNYAKARYDLIFRTSAGPTIAVLKYKKRGIVRFRDFQDVWIERDKPA